MASTHSSRFATTLAIGLMLVSTCVTTCETVITATASVITCAWRWVVDLVLAPLATTVKVVHNLPGPAVALIAARQFLLRQIKRARPVCTPGWRMCPSG